MKLHTKSFIVLLVSIAIHFACGKSQHADGGDGDSEPALDSPPAAMPDDSAADAKQPRYLKVFAAAQTLFPKFPHDQLNQLTESATDENPTVRRCIEDALPKLTVRARGDTASVSSEIDISDCVRGGTGTKTTAAILFEVKCPSRDLSHLDGHPLAAIATDGKHPCSGVEAAHITFNVEALTTERTETIHEGQSAVVETENTLVTAMTAKDGGSCVYKFDDRFFYKSGCVEISRNVIQKSRTLLDDTAIVNPDEGKVHEVRIEFDEIKGDSIEDRLLSGKLHVRQGDWQAEVIIGDQPTTSQ